MRTLIIVFLITPWFAVSVNAADAPLFIVVHAFEREDFPLQSRMAELFQNSTEWQRARRIGLINDDYKIEVPAYEAALTETLHSPGGQVEMPLRSPLVSMSGGFAQLCFSQAIRDVVNQSSKDIQNLKIEILADYVYVKRGSVLDSFSFYFTGFLTENERQRLRLTGAPAVVENFPQLINMRVKTSMEAIRALEDPEREGLLFILRDLYDLSHLSFLKKEDGPRDQLKLIFEARSQSGREIEFSVRLCPQKSCH